MKVLIIDDEYYFRQALKSMLQKSGLVLEVCGEAKDGEEGLEIIKREKPEIVLVDINMPFMDGLTFIKNAKEIHQQIKFVIITGYNEFDYAQKAIALGVRNYLLKPLEQEEFFDVLQAIMEEILRERKKDEELKKLLDFTRNTRHVERMRMLHDLLMGDRDFSGKREQEHMHRSGIQFTEEMFAVACIMLKGEENHSVVSEEELECVEERIKKKFADWNINFYVSPEYIGEIGVLFNFSKDILWQEKIQEILQLMIAEFDAQKELIYGIGASYRNLQKIYLSYQEAQQMCYQQKLYGNSGIFYKRSDSHENLILTEEKKILIETYLNISNISGIEQIIMEFQREAIEQCITRSNLMLLAVALLNICFKYAQINRQKEVLQEYFEFLIRKLQTRKSVEEIFEYVLLAYRASVWENEKKNQKKKSAVVIRTLEYIHENYTNSELVIEQIAKAVFTNSSYLCCIFKNEVGVTINKYILQIRLMNAKERMENGETYVKKIALECGFTNESYFGKCFRNEFLMSPSEYIKTLDRGIT